MGITGTRLDSVLSFKSGPSEKGSVIIEEYNGKNLKVVISLEIVDETWHEEK